MTSKLCIIIESDYSKNPKAQMTNWQQEVDADTINVTTTLNDHDAVIIKIPPEAKPRAVNALVEKALMTIKKPYDTCHIVLNTHGAAGSSDLTDAATKEALAGVSSRSIVVSQLTALQCNGMSALSSQEQRDAKPMRSIYAVARGKESSMSILQKKLNHMKTMIPQEFKIVGLSSAYDPLTEKDLVAKLLTGTGGAFLEVKTTTPQLHTAYLGEISRSIDIIETARSGNQVASNSYDNAGNIIGKALEKMKEDILASLKNNTNPDPQNEPLLQKLTDYSRTVEKTLDAENLNSIFKKWLKANKLRSQERVDVIKQYHSILSTPSQEPTSPEGADSVGKSLTKIGLFAPERKEPRSELPPQAESEFKKNLS